MQRSTSKQEERGGSGLPLPVLGLLLMEAGREAEAERFFLKEGREQELVPQGSLPPAKPLPGLHLIAQLSPLLGPGMTLSGQRWGLAARGSGVCSALGPDH